MPRPRSPREEAEDLFGGSDNPVEGSEAGSPGAFSWLAAVVATAMVAAIVGAGVWLLPPLWRDAAAPPMVVLELPPPGSGPDRSITQADPPPHLLAAQRPRLETAPAIMDRGGGVTVAAVARLPAPADPTLAALVRQAPSLDPALSEPGPDGPLPRIADDGRTPLEVYARASAAGDQRPRIALVIADIGLSVTASEAAIRLLPPEVTLAIDPYADVAADWAKAARAGGREILLALPARSQDFPFRDPGPEALAASTAVAEDRDRLHRLMARFGGFIGVFSAYGDRLEQREDVLRPVAEELSRRGLMYVGGGVSRDSALPALAVDMGLPFAVGDLWIDEVPSAAVVDHALGRLEAIARERGVAVGMGRPLPLTVGTVARWARDLEERGVILVPISGVAGRQIVP